MTENIKKFAEAFFTNLKCNIEWKENNLIVKDVPADFEKYYGKKSPYTLVFDSSSNSEEAESMFKGSFLLKAMTDYLDNRGETTLLKLDFNTDLKEEIKKSFNFNNSEIFNVVKNHENKVIFRFTFLTTFQYLNEKEQIINPIYVENDKVINFDISKYNVIEGKNEEFGTKEIKEKYILAKERLKLILNDKTKELSNSLSIKLDKELQRIKEHYTQQISESEEKLNSSISHLKELESQTNLSSEKEIKLNDKKIKKLKESIEFIKTDDKIEKLSKELDFFINDEIHKHGLNIDNKLINTTIIYYPIFSLNLFLKNTEVGRQVDLSYNPLKNEISPIMCESCKKQINNVFLCSSGHINCRDCQSSCGDCSKKTCKNCLIKECGYCGKRLCRKCGNKCSKCWKTFCNNHVQKGKFGQICSQCSAKDKK